MIRMSKHQGNPEKSNENLRLKILDTFLSKMLHLMCLGNKHPG